MRSLALAAVVGAVLSALVPASALAPAHAQETLEPARLRSDAPAVARLTAAVNKGRTAAFDARLVVIAFDTGGPSVVELEVSQADGELRVSRGESWTLGRSETVAFVQRAGELLQLGSVDAPGFRSVRLTSKYAVRSLAPMRLDTGEAEPLELIERDTARVRERLYLDAATGLVVRRETFDDEGAPVRLAAFTDLRVRSRPMSALVTDREDGGGPAPRALTPLSDESLEILADVGWYVPEELPAGFALQGGYALPESEGGSVHLIYSDGLYTLSLYEQFGRLDRDSLRGAVLVDDASVHAWTWPGSQPERLVWSGDGLTFTVVSDAPDDALVAATEALPHRRPAGLPARMVRGLGRVVDWVWPFN